MTSTVRSVRVVMEADVAGYIAAIRAAGHETDAAFSHTGTQLAGVNRGLKEVDTSTTALGKSTEGLGKRSVTASNGVGRLASTLDKQTGVITQNTRAMAAKRLADRGVLEIADRLGLSITDVTEAALGNDQALVRVNRSLIDSRATLQATGSSTKDFDGDAKRLTKTISGMDAQLSTAQQRFRLLQTAMGDSGHVAADVDREVKKVATSSNGAGKEVDKLSGRLTLLRDVGITLGPALIPLAEGILPAITGGIAGLGAGASAIGVAVLALHGLGAGIKALDAYKLDPTIENLAKLRAEEQKLGPAGTQFLHYIDQLEPKLRGLQQVARAGWFPGLEQGITDLLQRLPLVRGTVKSISEEMGILSADAGHALSSSEWRPFFQYVRSQAAPTLDAFARSAGSVALGLANMLVAFGPASSGFASGLEEDTRRFANWSKTLDQNKGFQDFVAEVRRDGHEALQLLSATVSALGAVVKAAQPLGQVTLPILTELVHVFAAVAGSRVGPALYAAAAAMIFYNRATVIADKTQKSFQSGMLRNVFSARSGIAAVALLADSVTGYSGKLGLANTSMDAMAGLIIGGPWGAAVGAGIGLVQDITKANDGWTASIQAADDALRSGDASQMQQQLASVNAELAKVADAKKPIQGLSDLGRVLSAGHVKNQLSAAIGDVTGKTEVLTERQGELQTALAEGGGVADLFGETIGLTGRQMAIAAGDATALDKALAHLNGWFSRRDAVYAYKDAVDALTKGLKDGFNRKDAEQLDQVGESILQVANKIRNPAHRADFLASARAELESIAKNAGPQARKALQDVIAAFDDKGLTHPKTPKLDPPDTKPFDAAVTHVKRQAGIMSALASKPTIGANADPFLQIYGVVKSKMGQADGLRATPKVSVDPGNSFGVLLGIQSMVDRLHGKTITIQTVHTDSSGVGYQHGLGHASGGYITGPGTKTSDSIPARLSRGEYVMPASTVDHYGLGVMDALRARQFAGGGPVDTHSGTNPGDRPAGDAHNKARDPNTLFVPFGIAVDATTKGLKGLKAELGQVQKAYDKEKQKLSDLTQARSSTISAVSGSLIHDPFGNGLAGFDAQVAADTGDISAMAQALATLVSHGLDPKSALYQALAASDDVTTAQQLAALSSTDLSTRANSFAQRQDQANALGTTVGNQAYAQAIREETQATRDLRTEVKYLTAVIKDLPKHVKDGAAAGSKEGSKAGSEAGAAAGTARGMAGRSQDLRNQLRTGAGIR